MSPLAQRDAVLNFINNGGDTSKPDILTTGENARRIISNKGGGDPMYSRDTVFKALSLLSHGQRVAFQIALERQMPRIYPSKGDYNRANITRDTSLFDFLTVDPAILCKVLLQVVGKWDPKL